MIKISTLISDCRSFATGLSIKSQFYTLHAWASCPPRVLKPLINILHVM